MVNGFWGLRSGENTMDLVVECSFLTDLERVSLLRDACDKFGIELWWSASESFLCSLHANFPTKDARSVIMPFLHRLQLMPLAAEIEISPCGLTSDYDDLACLMAFAAQQWDVERPSAVMFPQPWSYHQVDSASGTGWEVAVGDELGCIRPQYLLQRPAPVESLFRLALLAALRGAGAPAAINSTDGYGLGKQFMQRVRLLPTSVLSALLTSCAHTILNINMGRVHELRINKGGGSPQLRRKRDNAGAMRRDVYGVYHLHYWAGNVPEFAWVTTKHDDFRCPE